MRRDRLTRAARLLAGSALLLGPLAACGSAEPVATTVASDSYSCTTEARDRLADLRAALAGAVPELQGKPRKTDYCDGGMDAGVEFRVRGALDEVGPELAAALDCGPAKSTRVALGRQLVHRCVAAGAAIELSLVQYLPAGDPRGASVLGHAMLLPPSES